ncbi:hypothetical protein L1887_13942 [Cichorium endivia]|nr:hypothetical protein L1887_13942 [Cichorium endivia]
MSVKMRTTCTWTERPYEASLFPGIGFGLFLRSLGGGRRRPPSGGSEPSVRYHSGRARILTLCQDVRAKGQSQINHFFIFRSPEKRKILSAYDVAPGGLLASVYHLTRIEYGVDQPEEVCIKVFAPRRDPRIPFVFWVWKSVDFQERESLF